jgi:hypothetical protein
MHGSPAAWRLCSLLFLGLLTPSLLQEGQAAEAPAVSFQLPEKLYYGVEWRLIDAGNATLTMEPEASAEHPRRHSTLEIQSTGLVSKLYKVHDTYTGEYEDQFCVTSSLLNAAEGHRRRETKVTFERNANKAIYLERDLIKNSIVKSDEIDIPQCVHDVIGGLYRLRTMDIAVGQSAQIPMSDGKKSVSARVEAQERELVKTKSGSYKTIRYEAFLFDGVLYKRRARLFVWLTDDARRLPVQIRVRMQFVIGTITLQLEKEEHS